jgi:hypothetical protein
VLGGHTQGWELMGQQTQACMCDTMCSSGLPSIHASILKSPRRCCTHVMFKSAVCVPPGSTYLSTSLGDPSSFALPGVVMMMGPISPAYGSDASFTWLRGEKGAHAKAEWEHGAWVGGCVWCGAKCQ